MNNKITRTQIVYFSSKRSNRSRRYENSYLGALFPVLLLKFIRYICVERSYYQCTTKRFAKATWTDGYLVEKTRLATSILLCHVQSSDLLALLLCLTET
jgi:hypothetical protein